MPAVSPWPITYTYSPHPLHHSLVILPFYDLRCSLLKPYIYRTLVVGRVKRLQATQPIHRASNPIRGKKISLVYTASRQALEPTQLFHEQRRCLLGGKEYGREKNLTTSIWCTEIKNKWSYTSINLNVLMARIVTTLTRKGKGKGKFHITTGHEDTERE
jgi:hypothetical protein